MNEALDNNIAGWVGLSGLIPALGVTLTYGLFAPWYHSWLGRVLFSLFAAFVLVYIVFTVQKLFGRIEGYGLFSLIVFALIMLAMWAVWLVIIHEQILRYKVNHNFIAKPKKLRRKRRQV